MTNYLKKLLAVLFLGSVCVTPALAWETKSMNKHIDETNFLVNKGCSGTLIDKSGLVLTAAHCIVGQYQTVEKEVVDKDGKVKKEEFQVTVPGSVSQQFYSGATVSQRNSYIYKIVKTDRSLDLALLKIQSPPSVNSLAELSCSEVTRGEQVFAVGNSYGVLYSTLTKGIVSSVNRSYTDLDIAGQLGDTTDNGEHGLTQHSAVIAGGNSGGALYNEDGKLVGVNVRGAASGFSFAVPLSDIQGFLSPEVPSHCG